MFQKYIFENTSKKLNVVCLEMHLWKHSKRMKYNTFKDTYLNYVVKKGLRQRPSKRYRDGTRNSVLFISFSNLVVMRLCYDLKVYKYIVSANKINILIYFCLHVFLIYVSFIFSFILSTNKLISNNLIVAEDYEVPLMPNNLIVAQIKTH